MRIVEVFHDSAEYWWGVQLRRDVLRLPLGLDFSEAELEAESGEIHLLGLAGTQLVGCLILRPVDARVVKMRQVAIDPELQGQGLGRKLVEEAERLAQDRSFSEVELHARHGVAEFYRRMGYEPEGEPFMEVGIPHVAMRKRLTTYPSGTSQ